MRVNTLTFEGFRNLAAGKICPGEDVNIFYGNNAQGKTNVLEAIWLFTGARSFRGAKDRELVQFGCEKALLTMDLFAGDREQQAKITVDTRRHAELNGLAGTPASKLAGKFCGIVFSPTHLSLIKEGPEGRRRFVDAAYCQLRPAYIRTLSEYNRVLTQRNAVLKAEGSEELLSLWDEKLAKLGSKIILARAAYLRKLEPVMDEIYSGLSSGKETLTLQYLSAVPVGSEEAVAGNLFALLKSRRREDRGAGFTTAGVHREDIGVDIDGLSARTYGSQGQQRSAVLAMKLAEAAVLREITGEQPIALLDDVMSELDVSRQDYILNRIKGWQVFITCCDPASVLRLTEGKAFEVNGGVITEQG